ncbi:hypothetical protein L1887_24113 [Cichorium endivia]|nr:hypothetical protein L1887_24113 [Cichorium endivia]
MVSSDLRNGEEEGDGEVHGKAKRIVGDDRWCRGLEFHRQSEIMGLNVLIISFKSLQHDRRSTISAAAMVTSSPMTQIAYQVLVKMPTM